MNYYIRVMQEPLVSILIPFKNTALYLDDCISSIIKQTYSNWELIIVDDVSDDNSYNIVESYAKNDSRIRLLKNKGNGLSMRSNLLTINLRDQ